MMQQKINQEFEPTNNTLTDELMGLVWRYILNCFFFYLFIYLFIHLFIYLFDYLFIARNRPGFW